MLSFTLVKVVIYQSIYSSCIIWQAFWRKSSNFSVWIYREAVCDIFWSVFLFEFNPLPDLLNTGFTIIEFMVANTWERKYAVPDIFWQITSRWRFLVRIKSGMTACEKTSSNGWVLLMFYWNIELNLLPKGHVDKF